MDYLFWGTIAFAFLVSSLAISSTVGKMLARRGNALPPVTTWKDHVDAVEAKIASRRASVAELRGAIPAALTGRNDLIADDRSPQFSGREGDGFNDVVDDLHRQPSFSLAGVAEGQAVVSGLSAYCEHCDRFVGSPNAFLGIAMERCDVERAGTPCEQWRTVISAPEIPNARRAFLRSQMGLEFAHMDTPADHARDLMRDELAWAQQTGQRRRVGRGTP